MIKRRVVLPALALALAVPFTASPPASAASTDATKEARTFRTFAVTGEAWCNTGAVTLQPCGKVTIYGNGVSESAAPVPVGALPPAVPGTFRFENIPGGQKYKIEARTDTGPFVFKKVLCTKDLDLTGEQWVIGDTWWLGFEPWSIFNACSAPQ